MSKKKVDSSPSLVATDSVVVGNSNQVVTRNLKVMVAKSPLAMDWRIILEGQTFYPGNFRFNGKYWELDLPAFPITGKLDAILQGRGIDNGVQRGRVTARILSNGQALSGGDLDLLTVKGYGIDSKSYVV